MTPDMTPNPLASAAALRNAATYLELFGWFPLDYFYLCPDRFPSADVVGAISVAVYGRAVYDPFDDLNPFMDPKDLAVFTATAEYFDQYLRSQHGYDHGAPLWNEQPERTLSEVTTTLRNAADDLEASHDRQNS
ncbi:DUF6197 family protein [Dactylosporangium sp. CA-139066]|uniref:DUF6197 family protein n=1 Tax=Dactylosporangium sp. CA-139066 TaxID=3239930 RepID=UPI003D8DF7CB